MNEDFADLIEQMTQRAAAMQSEIDAAIDAHGALCRARDLLAGTGSTVPLVPLTAALDALRADAFDDAAPPPPKAKPAAARKPRQSSLDWAEVFDWVKAAKADGTYSLKLLIEEFGTPAKNWRVQCANRGLDLDEATPAEPTPPAAASTPAPSPVVDIRRTFSPADATDLLDAM